MAQIIQFHSGESRLDIDPDLILEGAKGELQDAVVIGFRKDGSFFFASTHADGGTIMWLLESAKLKLLQGGGTLNDA